MTAVRTEIILTTFVEGLANSVVRWEVRKSKPTSVEDAVQLANEMQSYLNIHGQQPESLPTSSVNNVSTPLPSQNDMFSDLIFTIKEEVKRAIDQQSGPSRRGRSSERSSNNRSQNSNRNSHHQNSGPHRGWQQNQGQRNRTDSRGNTPNRSSSQESKQRVSFNSKPTGNSQQDACERCYRTNHATKDCKACFKCGRMGHFRRDCRSRSQPLN